MPVARYSIGIDFGTESGRAVLVRVQDGQEMATAVHRYAHGVLDDRLPDGKTPLGHDWALQHPADYIEVVRRTIPKVLKDAGVRPQEVIGIGTDFTACTMLPVAKDGTPLCLLPEFASEPHAWVKLWKHHAAQPEADLINETARRRGDPWLPLYGGRISAEWFFAKLWSCLRQAPHVYAAADRFLEAADWIVLQLTGEEKRNACTAGYKALWNKRAGYPAPAYFKALDPRLEHVVREKLPGPVHPLGERAGTLTPRMARLTGLLPGTAVAVGNVDAHVAVPAATVTHTGRMVMIMGTSICHMVLGHEQRVVEGMCGVVEDGILPGFFGYEAGQSAVGDIFAWFVTQGAPAALRAEARKRKIDLHQVLADKAATLRPGQSGLLALDWWNGNRSVLVDADLSGVVLGATLATRPEEVYRALIEATAFGTNKIIAAFDAQGVPIRELYACGGLPDRNPLLMQIFADVTGREIRIAASAQTPALGAAIFGAVAAGRACGGYDTVVQAAAKMAHLRRERYRPDRQAQAVYRRLYAEYEALHDYFGRGGNDVMKRLKRLKTEVATQGRAAAPGPAAGDEE